MSSTNNRIRVIVGIVFKVVPIVVGLVGLTLVIAWISGFFEEKISPGETQPTGVQLAGQETDEVHEVVKNHIEEAVGTLKAASRSQISAKILATIQNVHVVAGDSVSEGDLLVTLNTQELNARLNQAVEVLTAASAAADEADKKFERVTELFQSNAISQQEFDLAKRNLDISKADERRAKQAVEESNVLLSYSQIKAPKSGRIVDRLAEPGDTAQPGKPLLTLYDVNTLRLETPVLESHAIKLKVGQQLVVHVDSVNKDFTATIDEIVPQADAASRSFLVKASLPRSQDLYEGMFGRLRIPAGERKHLCLATNAIRRIGQLEFVDVVDKDDLLHRRLIKTGKLGMPGRVEVLSGVEAGDRVVLYPSDFQSGSESE